MRNKDIIDYIYIKCSNNYISNRLKNMSISERKQKLGLLTNQWEKWDYNHLLETKEMYEFIGDWNNQYILEEYDKVNEELLKYDKRIFRGYDLNKNKDKIPEYNISDFKMENVPESDERIDVREFNILPVEQAQID